MPAFRADPQLGRLTVAGEFNAADTAASMHWIADSPGFERGFMGEDQLLQKARAQDYLLMLYDADPRVESAVLYLAARALRQVLVRGLVAFRAAHTVAELQPVLAEELLA